ncbi:MAG: hypothetical protein WD114_02795 [Phycisphaerales bacterium]
MTEKNTIEIALVGHCGPDAYALQSAVKGAVPGSSVHRVNTKSELDKMMDQWSLLLVNRVLDGDFGHESGIEFIRDMIGELGEKAPKAMLISNLPEALAEAEQVGAVPGFGKRAMRSPEAETALKNALAIG